MVLVYDLDDTLYNEIDFVQSGLFEVARFLGDENKYYTFMLELFEKEGSGSIFDKVKEKFSLDDSVAKMVEIYRFHQPKIFLEPTTIALLEWSQSYKTALISDGHYITQQNKFYALGLQKYITYPIFTDFYHTKKPELKPFEMVMQHYNDEQYIYISDNPKKDFFAPHQLGWKTIRYKNPQGIYRAYPNNATYEVTQKEEIISILKECL